jgi:CxxC motif-containing protein (DUF1111 family)
MRYPALVPILAAAAALTAFAASESVSDSTLSAGTFTVQRFDREAYLQPAAVLDRQQLMAFHRGRKHFDKKWASVSSLDFEWGLGPTFIAKS